MITLQTNAHYMYLNQAQSYIFFMLNSSKDEIGPAHVKMPKVVGILTFISMIKTTIEILKVKCFTFQHFSFYEQMKF